jgi:hypothetical protein
MGLPLRGRNGSAALPAMEEGKFWWMIFLRLRGMFLFMFVGQMGLLRGVVRRKRDGLGIILLDRGGRYAAWRVNVARRRSLTLNPSQFQATQVLMIV